MMIQYTIQGTWVLFADLIIFHQWGHDESLFLRCVHRKSSISQPYISSLISSLSYWYFQMLFLCQASVCMPQKLDSVLSFSLRGSCKAVDGPVFLHLSHIQPRQFTHWVASACAWDRERTTVKKKTKIQSHKRSNSP